MTRVPTWVIVCLVVPFLVATFAGGAHAASVLKLTDEQLVNLSRSIVVGQITDMRTAWNQDNTQIITTITVSVSDVVKGRERGQRELSFRVLGGRVGDTVMEVSGAPTFDTGEDVILFFDHNERAIVPIVGMTQGKLTIERDPATGARMIRERGESPDAFLQKIRGIVEAQREVE